MDTKVLASSDPLAIPLALETLRRGGLAAFPTDTVYGVGVLAFDGAAIDRLFGAKGHDASKAIAVLLGSADDLTQVASEMGETARRLAQRFWPGPLTLVVPRQPYLPANLSPLPTIGVRMPDHPLALALLRQAGPLAVTSANRSGEASPRRAQEVLDQLGGRIDLLIDGGETPGGAASTVVDCTHGDDIALLRPGPISLDELLAALS